ncbi:MAG: hypothetical protein AUH42_03250 [Gemmatimonadetes bacterium 13_1_40CM_70_11]|nr:MAG: hypothetical protein AUH42_03250 [Gemmatimonadetes bacterium 13_1_40CM_70_11]
MRLRLAALALPLVWGCYSYTSLGSDAPPARADVIARLAAPTDIPLEDVTVHEVTLLDGHVIAADGDSLVLALTRFTATSGVTYAGFGARVAIPRVRVADLQLRRVSAARTALLIGGGAAALVGIVASVGPLFGGGDHPPPGGPPPLP